jgi:hypothetical protein
MRGIITMSDDIWDDPDLQLGTYVKFEQSGDAVSGGITAIEKTSFTDTKTKKVKVVPQLFITTDDGEEVILTAGQVDLRIKFLENRPQVGDHIYVELLNDPKPGEQKKFEVQINS